MNGTKKMLIVGAAGVLLSLGMVPAARPVAAGAPRLASTGAQPGSSIAPNGVYAVDMAVPAGIAETTSTWTGSAIDYDNDGCTDILLNRHQVTPRLYHSNCNGTFTEMKGAFTRADLHEQAWGDFNGDGLVDLYWATGGGAGYGMAGKQLWFQQPDHTFVNRITAWKVNDPFSRGRGTTAIDVNHDGKLDLFVGNKSPRVDQQASPNRLFLNQGSSMVEAPQMGLAIEQSVVSAQAIDYDGDGYQDLLIAGEHQSALLHNDAGTGFTDVSRAMGLPAGPTADARMADLNGDGKPDLVILPNNTFDGVQVYLQVGGVLRLSYQLRLISPQSVAVGDVNGDGAPDLYVVERRNLPIVGDPDRMLINNGKGTAFTNLAVPQATGGLGDAAWPIDYDNNGLMDFVVTNGAFGGPDGPVQLIAFFPNPPGGKPQPTFGGVGAVTGAAPTSDGALAPDAATVSSSAALEGGSPSAMGVPLLVSASSTAQVANAESMRMAVSDGGRYVAFESFASNLVPGDGNLWSDIFVRDTATGSTIRVSVSTSGGDPNGPSAAPVISADGRYVAFFSSASNLVPGDTNQVMDIFERDLQTGTTVLVSFAAGGGPANGESTAPSINADGRYVAFQSRASNLVARDTNSHQDVFVRDVLTGVTTIVSASRSGVLGNDESIQASVSATGRYVAFASKARNLGVGVDTNNLYDVFLRDVQTGSMTKVDVPLVPTQQTSATSLAPSVSADGRYVSFSSAAKNLTSPAPTTTFPKVFVRDVVNATTVLASVTPSGAAPSDMAIASHLSADGHSVVFTSAARGLVTADQDNFEGAFLRDLVTGTTYQLSTTAGGASLHAFSRSATGSPDNRYVAWNSPTRLLVSNPRGETLVFERDLGFNP